MNRPEFEHLVESIIISEFPESLSLYRFEKDDLMGRVFTKTGSIDIEIDDVNKFEDAGEVVKYINMILATFKTAFYFYEKFTAKKKEAELEKVKSSWVENLTNEGLSKESATRIADKFQRDIQELIKREK